MYKFNEKLADLVPYDPICGDYKIRLDANESYFNLDEDEIKKINEKVKNTLFMRYPDSKAESAVKAFCDLYDLKEDLVTAGNGSDELISVIISAFLMKGETLLTLSHDFSMYAFYASIAECKVAVAQKDESLNINADTILQAIKKNDAKALIFSNPCNPTSLGLRFAEVEKIVKNTDALVILDEAYMDFWAKKDSKNINGDESLLHEVEKYDNLIVLKTVSKALGLASIRLGFAVANKKISDKIKAVKAPYNVNRLTQDVASVILADKDRVLRRRNEILANKEKLFAQIKDIFKNQDCIIYESFTNFVFIKTQRYEEIFNSLLEKSIVIRKFSGFIRITVGSNEENEELIKALKEIV